MFCKYCGKKIDLETMQCIGCGKPAGPLEGGIGFWDLAGERPPTGPSFESWTSSEKTGKKIRQISLQQNTLNRKMAVLSVFIVLAFVCIVIGGAFLAGMIHRLYQNSKDLQDSMQAMLAQESESAPVRTPEEILFGEFSWSDVTGDTAPTDFEPEPTAATEMEEGTQPGTIPLQDSSNPWQMWDVQSGTWISASRDLAAACAEELGEDVQCIFLLKSKDGAIDKIYLRRIASGTDTEEGIAVTEAPAAEDFQ